MNILITTDQLSRGGKEKQLMVVAKGLVERGYYVNILCIKPLDKNNYYFEYKFPLNDILNLNDKNYFTGFIKFKKKITQLKPDIILTFDIQTTLWSIWLQWFRHVPFINHSIQRGTPYPGKEQWILKYIAKRSKVNIANSKAGLAMLDLKQNKNNLIINSPIDLKDSDITMSFKEIFGFDKPKNASLLINMGNISLHKGQHTIIEALELLNDQKIYMVFLGEGPNKAPLENRVKNSVLHQNIKFLGQVSNVEKYLRLSDLYVHASKGEGSSNAILEALISNLPVISTLTGGTKEISEVVEISSFQYEDSTGLSNKIREFLKGDIQSPNISKLKTKYYDKETYVDAFVEVFKSTIIKKHNTKA